MTRSPRTVVFLIGDAGPDPQGVADAWRALDGAEVVAVHGSADWWTEEPAAGLPADAGVVLADAAWSPGPRLVERLVAAGPGVVDARVLPLETTRVDDPRERGEEPEEPTVAPPLRVSAGCCLVPAGSLAQLGPLWRIPLGEGRGARLADWAEHAGVDVVVEPTATVVLPVRVDDRGVPLGLVDPAATEAFEPPTDLHPAALPATSLATLLDGLGLRPAALPADPSEGRPFLSVVTRTQGTRLQCLEEVLTCLAAQTNRDFELLVVCHRVADAARDDVRRVVAAQPGWLQERTRLLDVERPGRTAPLNDGFEAARGRYIAILDDDDTVLAHWVETFAALERTAPGPVLRAATVRQDAVPLPGADQLVAVSVGNPFAAWAPTFELVDHLQVNHSPPLSLAFPRGAFHDLGLRFDESLAVTEDWDFLVRVAGLVGVRSSPEVTSVYRWWRTQASSREMHGAAEWEEARDRVLANLDRSLLLLPPGAVARLREITDAERRRADAAREEALSLGTTLHEVIQQLDETGSAHERTMAAWQQTKQRLARANSRADQSATEAKRLGRRLAKRTARFRTRQRLMRHADDLLQVTGTRAEHPSVFEMRPKQLRALIARLEGRPAGRAAGRGRKAQTGKRPSRGAAGHRESAR